MHIYYLQQADSNQEEQHWQIRSQLLLVGQSITQTPERPDQSTRSLLEVLRSHTTQILELLIRTGYI